jgi:hypothetical protein
LILATPVSATAKGCSSERADQPHGRAAGAKQDFEFFGLPGVTAGRVPAGTHLNRQRVLKNGVAVDRLRSDRRRRGARCPSRLCAVFLFRGVTKGSRNAALFLRQSTNDREAAMNRNAETGFEMVVAHDPQSHPKDYLFQDPRYCEQDEARLDAWRKGQWHFVGIRAKATIKFPYGDNPDCWITSELLSPGLWSVESDSGDEYFRQVYEDERAILRGMLDSLKPPNHDRLARACQLLADAYAKGEETRHVDWEDVDLAHEAARQALSIAEVQP